MKLQDWSYFGDISLLSSSPTLEHQWHVFFECPCTLYNIMYSCYRHSQEPREDDHSLDATQNNVIQLSGCTAEVSYDEDIIALAGEKYIIKLNTKKNGEIFFAFTSREDMIDWYDFSVS